MNTTVSIGEQLNIVIQVMTKQFTIAMERAAKVMQRMFPRVSEAHRAEVKRVHTAYRRKKRGRW